MKKKNTHGLRLSLSYDKCLKESNPLKNITTLVKDIHLVLDNGKIDPSLIDEFTTSLGKLLKSRFNGEKETPSLRMSNFGKPNRQLWYSINQPDKAEPLRPEVKLKFLYGDIVEHMMLLLIKASGHTVKGEQDELDINGLKGHRDAIVDGVLVDVKSASSYAFDKFAYGKLKDDDAFGYIDQLSLYLTASQDDVDVKKQAAFVAVNKENGKIAVDTHTLESKDYNKELTAKRGMLAEPTPPDRCYDDVEDGKSGNRKLGVNCSYCPFKHTCWPGLRTFISKGEAPKYLTKVVREPNMAEIVDGKITTKENKIENNSLPGYRF